MKTKENIFIDLDGTIIDSHKGIYYSIDYSLEKANLPALDLGTKRKFIGPALSESYAKYNNASGQLLDNLLKYYRQAYTESGVYMNTIYPGIETMLKSLKEKGKKLFVATAKPEEFAKVIIDDLKIAHYFDDICGGTMDETRVEKADVLKYALEKNNITDKQTCVMIGDRKHDIIGAKAVGMESIGVLHGFGSKEEFKEAGATIIVKDAFEILNLF